MKWYEGASDGMGVEVKDKQVAVAKVEAGGAFARAGLQPGDRIVRVNGAGAFDLRSLNKLLCRAALAPAGEAEFDVRRNGKALTLTVKLGQ